MKKIGYVFLIGIIFTVLLIAFAGCGTKESSSFDNGRFKVTIEEDSNVMDTLAEFVVTFEKTDTKTYMGAFDDPTNMPRMLQIKAYQNGEELGGWTPEEGGVEGPGYARIYQIGDDYIYSILFNTNDSTNDVVLEITDVNNPELVATKTVSVEE